MPYHARRFVADLRGFRLWTAVLVVTGFLVALVSAMAAGENEYVVAGGALGPPQQVELSYLRVLDPDESLTRTVDSMDELKQSTLDEPGLVALMNAMDTDDRMFIVLYLQDFTNSFVYGGSVESGIAVIGAQPSWLPAKGAPQSDVLLWGQMPEGAAGVNNTHFGDLPVQRLSEENLNTQWTGAHNLWYVPGSEAIVLFRPDLARQAGVDLSSVHVADVLSGFTCACEVDELTPLAAEMTRAEHDAGTRRLYYAIGHEEPVNSIARSGETVAGLSAVVLLGIAAGFLLFEHAGAVVFWRRSRRNYSIEYRAGAPAWTLQLRQQATFFAAVTAPIVAGVWFQDVLFTGPGSPEPAPWHGNLAVALLVLGLAIQVIVGTRPFLGLRRDCRPTTSGATRV